MEISTDPISSVSEAVKSIADAIVALSPKTHPLTYRWKIHRLIERLKDDCRKFPKLVVEDLVHSECFNLEKTEQEFIIQVVKEELGLPIK